MATAMTTTQTRVLSVNDKRVLDALFDPETLPASVAKAKDLSAIDTSLPADPNIVPEGLILLDAQQHEIIDAVSSSESRVADVEAAISAIDQVISTTPNYASAYVNRAMLRRLRLESSLRPGQHIFTSAKSSIEALFTDLARAIHLSLPASSPTSPVSTQQARILRTAYSHRAFLYLKAAETDTPLNGSEKSELEELASKDFSAAARFGDEAAREMSVRTNPYAKMCGAIVRDALEEERRTFGTGV